MSGLRSEVDLSVVLLCDVAIHGTYISVVLEYKNFICTVITIIVSLEGKV